MNVILVILAQIAAFRAAIVLSMKKSKGFVRSIKLDVDISLGS